MSSDAACLACPLNSITDGERGQSSIAACKCLRDFFDTSDGLSQVNCSICPSGADCQQSAGNTLPALPVKRGYYRLHPYSIDVRRCPDAGTNCTDSSECEESTSGCRGTAQISGNSSQAAGRRLEAEALPFNSSSGCYDDLNGVFCRLCAPRHDDVLVFYAAATGSRRAQCRACRESARDNILSFIGYVALAAVVVLLLFCWYEALWSERRKRHLRRAWQAFTPHNKLKILIGFYMIVTKVSEVYEVALPAQVASVLADFAFGVSFGFNGVGSVLECLETPGYLGKLTVYIVFPFLLALLIVLVALAGMVVKRRRCTALELLETALPPLLKVFFLAYPLVTNVAFEAFACHKFTESEWLKADVSIQCGTPAHHTAIARAWVAIVLYPIGLLALNGGLLYAARKAILKTRPTGLSRAIGFLYREFEPQFFWWELVEMLRRFVLVGLMVLAQGSMVQLVMGTLLSAFFLLFQIQASPYASMADDFLASAVSFGLVTVFLCSIAFKYDSLVGLEDISSKMSIEQQGYYIVNQMLLSIIMLASVVGALVFSLVLFVVQFGVEARRLQQEVQSLKARRLRYKTSDMQAHAPAIAQEGFHNFLSHVWGTGQDQMRIVKQRLLEMIPDLQVFLDVDDLEVIGDLELYIERSSNILVYCSEGYFASKNCMRELVASVTMQKPLIALTDPERGRGGLSLEEIHAQLHAADSLAAKWGFRLEEHHDEQGHGEWHGGFIWPGSQLLSDALFASEPIEWNRIGHFQDVTMRLIAERLLPDAAGATYVDKEIVSQRLKPLATPEKAFHIYCSALNPGAAELMNEVSHKQGFTMQLDGALPERARGMTRGTAAKPNALHVTTEAAKLSECDHMLLYLTSQTWTRPVESAQLCAELMEAMDCGVHVLLAHEMPGEGGQAARDGCEFGSFFACPDGATPDELLKRGIYSEVAVPLKGGAWREASMMLLGMALGMSKDELQDAKEGGDVLGVGEKSKRAVYVLKRLMSSSDAGRGAVSLAHVTISAAEGAPIASPPTAPAAEPATMRRLQSYNAMFKRMKSQLSGGLEARKSKGQLGLAATTASPKAARASIRRNRTAKSSSRGTSSTMAVSVSVVSASASEGEGPEVP